MRDAPRHRTPRRLLRGAVPLAAVAALLAGCATHTAPPISAADLHAARTFKQFTVYWVGKRIDGVPLTAADNLADFNSGVGSRSTTEIAWAAGGSTPADAFSR